MKKNLTILLLSILSGVSLYDSYSQRCKIEELFLVLAYRSLNDRIASVMLLGSNEVSEEEKRYFGTTWLNTSMELSEELRTPKANEHMRSVLESMSSVEEIEVLDSRFEMIFGDIDRYNINPEELRKGQKDEHQD